MTHPHTNPLSDREGKKRQLKLSDVTHEARRLVWENRRRLAIGGILMIPNRLAGMVMPASSKWLIDDDSPTRGGAPRA